MRPAPAWLLAALSLDAPGIACRTFRLTSKARARTTARPAHPGRQPNESNQDRAVHRFRQCVSEPPQRLLGVDCAAVRQSVAMDAMARNRCLRHRSGRSHGRAFHSHPPVLRVARSDATLSGLLHALGLSGDGLPAADDIGKEQRRYRHDARHRRRHRAPDPV